MVDWTHITRSHREPNRDHHLLVGDVLVEGWKHILQWDVESLTERSPINASPDRSMILPV